MFAYSETIHLAKGDALIAAGEIVPDVFIVKEGIMRGIDFNGDRERTFCFGLPGTIFNSRFSFYKKLPSYYRIEACCPSTVLRINRDDYIALTDNNHAFAVWALHYAWSEQYLEEERESTVHNGNAEERYLHMLRNRRAIVEIVSQRILASYLGMSQEHLSRIKAKLLKQGIGTK